MSSFTTPLTVTPLSDGRNWKLAKPFSYHVGAKHSRTIVKVPAGFITDFASTPQFLWLWLPYWGKYGKASVIHDYLYHAHEKPRKTADQIFREAMIVSGTPVWKAQMMYLAVRIFGQVAWIRKCSR